MKKMEKILKIINKNIQKKDLKMKKIKKKSVRMIYKLINYKNNKISK